MNFDVITIGSATRDAIFKSDEFKTIESANFKTGKALAVALGSKIKIDELNFTTGGAATNAAATFARQELKTSAIFRIGRDVSGEAIKEEMQKENIDISFIQIDEKIATAYSVVLEENHGERTILNYRGANENLSPNEIPWNKFYAKWFYLTSLSGNLKFLENTIKNSKQNNLSASAQADSFIAWNPGSEDLKLGLNTLLPYLKNINVFLANQEEASILLNIPYDDINGIFKKFNEIIDGIAIITKGPDGSLASDGKNKYCAGIFKEKEIVDRTGAGDAFGSGFVSGLMHKNYNPTTNNKNNDTPACADADREAIKYALVLASANATSKVEYIGAKYGLLTKKQFEKSERFKNLPITII